MTTTPQWRPMTSSLSRRQRSTNEHDFWCFRKTTTEETPKNRRELRVTLRGVDAALSRDRFAFAPSPLASDADLRLPAADCFVCPCECALAIQATINGTKKPAVTKNRVYLKGDLQLERNRTLRRRNELCRNTPMAPERFGSSTKR
jgi:hypothetical protein